MNEIELLEKYVEGKNLLHKLEISIQILHESPEKFELINEREIVTNQINELRENLQNIENKEFSLEAKSTIIEQFQAYIRETSKGIKNNLRLSRNQSMMSENMLFGYIAKDIHNIISERIFGIHIPAYLLYTHSNSDLDSVVINELIEFLNSEILIVNSIESPDYIKLHNYYDGFISRMKQRFIN
jgi:hypothetical protein